MSTRHLHLNLFICDTGHHESAWRLPGADPDFNITIEAYQKLAQRAEEARLDSIFLADSPGIVGDPERRPSARLDPTLVLSAIAAVTRKIGLIGTASTTYNDPFNLARRFGSLDHLSHGRAGWNVVTTSNTNASRNFGFDEPPSHAERYVRADEFLEVTTKLWDSWREDAVVADKTAGVHALADRVRPINHRGKYYQVEGPLNLSRSPQGWPLLVQAGSSEDGKAFAAKWAEAVFTAQTSLEDAQAFYADLKARTKRYGRSPDDIKILPGIVPFIADSEHEALALERELNDLITPKYAIQQIASTLQIDPQLLALDGPLPDELPDESDIKGAKGRRTLIVELARREKLTVRDLIRRLGGGRGHWTLAGTPTQIADALQLYFENGAADGFNIMPPVLPSGFNDFADKVLPILRERGLFREEYDGDTLREHYGLSKPVLRT